MTTVARLTSTELLIDLEIDEISKSSFSLDSNSIYASEFDEVTSITVTFRRTANGALIINGSFDEVSGIGAPLSLEGDLYSLSGTEDLGSGSGSLDLQS